MRFSLLRVRSLSFLPALLLSLLLESSVLAAAYDPLDVGGAPLPAGIDLTVHDTARNRDIPVHVFLPKETQAAPVILLSPGLGGSYENYSYLSQHWAARGYVVVSIQHPGSDDSLWKDKPKAEALIDMKSGASLKNFLLRVKDIPAVLNQLEHWNKQTGHALFGRLNLKKVGMSGHSFGAITTQAVSGESLGSMGPIFTDPRITAALALSPSKPRRGDPTTAFSQVKIPWMLMTGTKDSSPISDTDAASRLEVYPNLHGAPKYEVILSNAEHSAFTNRELPGDSEPRNPNHHRVILALSTAFWDTYLRGNPAASTWLNGATPLSTMQDGDKWQLNAGSSSH